MRKAKTVLKKEEQKLVKLEDRTKDLLKQSEDAKAELADMQKLFGQQLIEGGDADKLSSELASKQSKASIFESALVEQSNQIAQQRAVVEKARQDWAQAETQSIMGHIVKDSLKMIDAFLDLQVQIHRNLSRTNKLHGLRTNFDTRESIHNINFNDMAVKLQQMQAMLESEPRILEKSKAPRASARGGYLDAENKQKTLGSAVRDWASAQVKS